MKARRTRATPARSRDGHDRGTTPRLSDTTLLPMVITLPTFDDALAQLSQHWLITIALAVADSIPVHDHTFLLAIQMFACLYLCIVCVSRSPRQKSILVMAFECEPFIYITFKRGSGGILAL